MFKRKVLHFAQHIEDLYRLVTLNFRHPHQYIKFLHINRLRKETNATLLIETGTFLGDTAARCARVFDRVITIELDKALAAQSTDSLARYPNVQVIQGDATVHVPLVLARPDVAEAIVFLDGHFSGGVTACGDVPEPACEEIEALGKYQQKVLGVVIDDFRCFGIEPGFPTKSALLRTIERVLGDNFDFVVELDQVLIWRKRSHQIP